MRCSPSLFGPLRGRSVSETMEIDLYGQIGEMPVFLIF
jgi:hypothetical protein